MVTPNTIKEVTFVIHDVVAATTSLPEDDIDHALLELLGERPMVLSLPEMQVVRKVGYHPLIAATFLAFSQHRPLILSPDIIWIAIAQGVAQHINNHSEELRSRLVAHQERKTIEIERDTLPLDSPEWWQENIHALRLNIRDQVKPELRDLLLCEFSTTGEIERTVGEIVTLDAFKSYFRFVVKCICGIPWITLEGTVEDWVKLRDKVERLAALDLDWWIEHLRPICDEFVAFAQGNPNLKYWQNICKLEEDYGLTYINGWMAKLVPYVKTSKSGEATQINPVFNGGGVTSDVLPSGISQVPFDLRFLNEEITLKFTGGFFGITQNPTDLSLRPLLAWGVCARRDLDDALNRIKQSHLFNVPTEEPVLPAREFSRGIDQREAIAAFYRAMDGAQLFLTDGKPMFTLLRAKELEQLLHPDLIETLPGEAQRAAKEWTQIYILCRNADGSAFAFLNGYKELAGKIYMPFYHVTGTDVRPHLRLVATSLSEFLEKLLNSEGLSESVLAESEMDIIARLEE